MIQHVRYEPFQAAETMTSNRTIIMLIFMMTTHALIIEQFDKGSLYMQNIPVLTTSIRMPDEKHTSKGMKLSHLTKSHMVAFMVDSFHQRNHGRPAKSGIHITLNG